MECFHSIINCSGSLREINSTILEMGRRLMGDRSQHSYRSNNSFYDVSFVSIRGSCFSSWVMLMRERFHKKRVHFGNLHYTSSLYRYIVSRCWGWHASKRISLSAFRLCDKTILQQLQIVVRSEYILSEFTNKIQYFLMVR